MSALPLVLIHTTAGNIDAFEELLNEIAPEIPTRYVLRDDLFTAAFAAGQLTDDIRTQTTDALKEIASENAGLVMCTCSTIGPGADDANLDAAVPVLRVDRPMMEEALKAGERIAVCATFSTTMTPTLDLLRRCARQVGKTPEIQEHLFEDALPAFKAGDMSTYMDIISEGLKQASKNVDVIVLAQASMVPALSRIDTLPVPILSSPRSGINQAIATWKALQAQ